jgi:hypothetical protein
MDLCDLRVCKQIEAFAQCTMSKYDIHDWSFLTRLILYAIFNHIEFVVDVIFSHLCHM